MVENEEPDIEKAKELCHCLEQGYYEKASIIVAELNHKATDALYQEIGVLARQIHDLLGTVDVNGVTAELPNTRTKLQRVITLMEAAANTTIEQIEHTLPLPESLSNIAGHLLREGHKLESKTMTVKEFPTFYKSMVFFLESVVHNSEFIHEKLNDILMAQDFQDLTGQSLMKVMNSVEKIEDQLVFLLKNSSIEFKFNDINAHESHIHKDTKDISPNISTQSNDTIAGQEEVDDILKELGF